MNIMLYAIPVFFLLIGLELLMGKLQQTPLYRASDAVSNISCGIVQQVTGVFFKVLTLAGYIFLYEQYKFWEMPDVWWSYLLLFLGVDFFYYWFHRYAHEISVFWGTHVVHHQSEDYNLSVALRQSAFQGFISSVFYLPLALLGWRPEVFILINTLQTLYQFWIHTETINKMPAWFEFLFNTPSHHRVHHGRNPIYIDKNHGGTLIIFDRLFGTFQAETEPVVYGVTKPLATWDPLWANLDYYRDLWRDWWRMPSWGDRLRMLWAKPGWRPAALGGSLTVPALDPVQAKNTKYHKPVSNALHYYVLVQYVWVLLGTTFFLSNFSQNLNIHSVIGAGLILGSVWSFGVLLDGHAWAYWVERLRHLALLSLAAYVYAFAPAQGLAALALGAWALVSAFWLWFLSKI